MKNSIKILSLLLFALLFSINAAFSDGITDSGSIAVVDYDKIAKNCAKYQELKKYQAQKTKELQDFMLQAQENVSKEKNAEKRVEMQQKFNAEYKLKKSEIERHYSEKIKEIDNSINARIQEKAKTMGYTLVLSKRGVFYGGEDITNIIEEVIK